MSTSRSARPSSTSSARAAAGGDEYAAARRAARRYRAEKDVGYLLATAHPAGRGKAMFFLRFGFTSSRWEMLRDALLDHARAAPVASTADTQFGTKYILDGPLGVPDRRRPRLRAVWFIPTGEAAPRFVTAYPGPGGRR
ncbi:MAG: DUF6883 domain-containing protein [Thiohalocapsa sp.]